MNRRNRILIINQYYPPDRSATAGILKKIVNHLCKTNEVVVLSGRPSYMAYRQQKWTLLHKVSESRYAKILRVGSTAFDRYTIVRRIVNYLSYLYLAFPIALYIQADVVFAMTDPPLAGLIGAMAGKLKKKPFVYYIQDLHPDMALASGMIKEGKIVSLWKLIHLFVMRSANRLIVIGDDMKERILEKGIAKGKVSVIRHGSSSAGCQDAFDEILINKIRKRYSFVFVYSGNIGNYGAWETLISGIKLVNNDQIGFVFIGEGQQKDKLIKMSVGTKNIEFLPFQPREKIPSILKAGDVQIISIKRNLEGLVVPSKLYPILGANKPVLCISDKKSDPARIISKYHCGIVADPDSPESISEAILNFYYNRDGIPVYEKNSQKAAKQFSQIRLIDELSKEINHSYSAK